MLEIIDRPTIQHSYVVRTSRLTRDGRQSRSVMIVSMIGVSCSPFLREFCDATNLPQRILATRGAKSEEALGPPRHSANNA